MIGFSRSDGHELSIFDWLPPELDYRMGRRVGNRKKVRNEGDAFRGRGRERERKRKKGERDRQTDTLRDREQKG